HPHPRPPSLTHTFALRKQHALLFSLTHTLFPFLFHHAHPAARSLLSQAFSLAFLAPSRTTATPRDKHSSAASRQTTGERYPLDASSSTLLAATHFTRPTTRLNITGHHHEIHNHFHRGAGGRGCGAALPSSPSSPRPSPRGQAPEWG
ncbi:hypothetical protein BDY17DRAFT_340002, partial [Neohortaea acidophila]